MPNKIEASIKKFLDKNSRAAGRMKKKKAGVPADSTDTMLEDEMARRQKFANQIGRAHV